MAFHESRDVRLVILDPENLTDNDISLPLNYVALSHCWGPPSKLPVKTTRRTLTQHTQRILFSDLCLSFKDAVELTANLGQRYLSIDSLCIIQDDPEDWKYEASKISEVYGNAIVTLSALSSADSTQGCRVASVQAALPGHRFFDLDAGLLHIRILEGKITVWDKEYGGFIPWDVSNDNPLRGRAWALQERELSVRNIHFSHNMILWECKTCQRTSELPWGPDDYYLMLYVDWKLVPNLRNEHLLASEAQTLRKRWYTLMEDYMVRALTYRHDKLRALSGLAHSFHTRMSSGRYLAGLWSHHLPYSLLWRTNPPVKQTTTLRPSSYRAPTWSYLSLDVPISYESQREDNFWGDEDAFQEPGSKCSTVRGFNITPSGDDLYGAIESASLQLRGGIVSFPLTTTTSWQARKELNAAATGVVYPDISDDFTEAMIVWCIAIRPEPRSSVQRVWKNLPERRSMSDDDPRRHSVDGLVMGLVLDKVHDMQNTYRRIGMIRWFKESLFDDVPISDFTLI